MAEVVANTGVSKESGYNVSRPAAAKAVEQHESVVEIKKQI